MRIDSIAVGPFAVNTYLLTDEGTGDALLVDPGDDVRRVQQLVTERGSTVRAILATHGHLAHVAGARELARRLRAPFRIHPEDRFLLAALPERAVLRGLPPIAPPEVAGDLAGGDRIPLGDDELVVLHTPGHSPGSVSLHHARDRTILCGDLLFRGSVGRTDAPGGSRERLLASIRERLLALGDDVTLLPGHGPATTVGEERAGNPFLSGELLR